MIAQQRSKSFGIYLYVTILIYWIPFKSSQIHLFVDCFRCFKSDQLDPPIAFSAPRFQTGSPGESEAIPGLELALRHMFLGVPWRGDDDRRWRCDGGDFSDVYGVFSTGYPLVMSK